MTASFGITGTILPASNNPITIDTQGFTLVGTQFNGATHPVSVLGNLVGANGVTGSNGANLANGSILINGGTITGGTGTGNPPGAGAGGSGVQLRSGSSLTNNGTIQGGSSVLGGGGGGVDFGGLGGTVTLTNNGTIRGGAGLLSNGVAIFARTGGGQIVNTASGTIEGGAGTQAIITNSSNNLDIINSGTISAGAGQANAIQLAVGSAGHISLELQAGSVINGNVVGGSGNANTLTLGGGANDTFDVSTIGTQYQNFDSFQKTGTSTWTLTGTGTAVTNWVISAGTLQLGNGGTSGSIIGNITNNSVFAFNRSDTLTYSGVISGTGTVRQDGTGTTVLTGANTYNGPTQVNAGTLRAGAAGAFSAASTFSVAQGAQLDLAGIDQTVAGLTNAGLVSLNTANGTPGTTLTVTGNYVGQGGTIALNTYLGADGSPTDRLVINGNASGSTLLDIRNVGGPGALTAANGIQLVQVDGTSTADAFRLAHAVAVGAFDYGLFMNAADQDWYLRSAGANGGPTLNASAQTTAPYADILGNYALASLGTLAQRDGNRVWPGGTPPQLAADLPPSEAMRYAPAGPVIYGAGAWGRIVGQYSSYDPKTGSSYTQSLGFTQAGYEGTAYESAAGDLSLGAYATVGTSRADIDLTRDPVTGAARGTAHITSTGYGLGATTTWLGSDGLYADGIGQFTWYDSDLSNQTTGNDEGWSSALSLEVGQRFAIGSGWAVVPQAQLAWTHVDFDSFTDENGSLNELGKGDSLRGRGGLRLEKLDNWKDEDGQTRRLQLYGVANLSYEFLDGTSVEVDSTEIDQEEKRLWGEIGLGGTYAWNDKWSLNGEASYGAALASDAGSNYAVKGTVGLRYRW
ncbi:autotransporter outer membrane beta-barrel domain-containing protein [Labrys miyagiensis]|nr:autotransporter outer membrane beta-barrel domain-containing protein [Labrys miyagiensis]